MSEHGVNQEDQKSDDVHVMDGLHAMSVEAALAAVDGRPTGLSEAEAAERLRRCGANRLPEPPRRSPFLRFLSHFHNVLIYVLLGAAVITASLGHLIDTGVILAVVIANGIIAQPSEDVAQPLVDVVDVESGDFHYLLSLA